MRETCSVTGFYLSSIYGAALIGFCVVLLLSAVNQPLNQWKWAKYESAEGTRGRQRFMFARET